MGAIADTFHAPGPLSAPFYLGDPSGISAFANAETSAANTFLLTLANLASSIAPPTINAEFPAGPSAPALESAEPPTFDAPVWTAPAIPTAFTEVLDIGDLEVAAFDDNPPAINYYSAPASFSGSAPTEPDINLTFDDPTLTVTLPAPPDLLSISVATFDGLNLPTFSAVDPVLTAVEPVIREYTPGAKYTSALLTGLQTSLLERITTGGTGLNQDVENAIWDRGREREAVSYRNSLAELERMESLGFMFPPGTYMDSRLKLITEMDAQNRGTSREVMIKSAELELDNVKHALTTATQLEADQINYANAVEQRLFDSCKYATEAGVQIYNAKVQAFTALVEVYRTKVQIYEALVRAEISKVDAYRAQVEAERAKAEVNTALVQQYRVQADVALANVEIFKAQIAAIQTKADIEKTKVEVYGEQIRGYTAQINAYTAGVEAFRASLEGEKTKQQVYQSQVEAFTARVNASARQIEARIEAYKGRIDAKNAEWEGYKAQVQGEANRVQSLTAIASAESETYKAEVSGIASFNDTLTKQWQVALDQNQRTSEIAINTAKANSELYVTVRNIAIDAAKTGATVSAQLGAAAINAINWSTSFSTSKSEASSFSQSLSSSESKSDSTSENTNYDYSYSV